MKILPGLGIRVIYIYYLAWNMSLFVTLMLKSVSKETWSAAEARDNKKLTSDP